MKSSAIAVATAMGLYKGIERSCQKNDGPIRSHQQQLLQLQWAHMRASGGAAKKVMGPYEAIGNSCCNCNGPIWGHQEELPKNDGPIQKHWQHLIENNNGPTLNNRPLYLMGPLVTIGHFYLMGPCGLSQDHWSNCTWVLTATTANICYIMWTASVGVSCLTVCDSVVAVGVSLSTIRYSTLWTLSCGAPGVMSWGCAKLSTVQ